MIEVKGNTEKIGSIKLIIDEGVISTIIQVYALTA